MTNVHQIISNLSNCFEEGNTYIHNLKNMSIGNELHTKELELLSNISTNIHLLKDELEELYYLLLDRGSNNKTAAEKERIRHFKINNKIQEMFIPYMMYAKLTLENTTTLNRVRNLWYTYLDEAENEHHLSEVLKSLRISNEITPQDLIKFHPLYMTRQLSTHADLIRILAEKKSTKEIL